MKGRYVHVPVSGRGTKRLRQKRSFQRRYQLLLLSLVCFAFIYLSWEIKWQQQQQEHQELSYSTLSITQDVVKKHTRAATQLLLKANSTSFSEATTTTNEDTKFILYFTKYWNEPDFQFGMGRQPFLDYQCPVDNCWAEPLDPPTGTERTKREEDYDAVLFSVQASDGLVLSDPELSKYINSWRQPYQRFVFVMMESQSYNINGLDHEHWNNFFNWTMTFQWKSDIPRPYGWFQPKKALSTGADSFYAQPAPRAWIPYNEADFLQTLPSRDASFHALAKRRKAKVAWIVSHCTTASLREEYVHQLRRYIDVDEFGGKCQRNSPACDEVYSIHRVDNCTKTVQEHYKFYLAFENQFCNDYVTEKFFRRMNDAVVIVLGQANYTQLAPPHSHLNVMDFDSPKALAEYIHELDQDDAKYLSYFWWKDHYEVRDPYRPLPTSHAVSSGTWWNNFGPSMCKLCEKLHADESLETKTKSYDNMRYWWRESAECGKLLPSLKARLAKDNVGRMQFRTTPTSLARYNAVRNMGHLARPPGLAKP